MGLRLNTNVSSLTVQTNLFQHTLDVSKHLSRLASGLRIEEVSDDPAGLGISTGMRSEILSVQAALRQVENGQGLGRQSEIVTTEAIDLLGKMKSLSLAAMDETLTTDQRSSLSAEFVASYAEIARLATEEYNDLPVVQGNTYSVFTGTDTTEEIQFVTANLSHSTVTLLGGFDLQNPVTAGNLIPFIDAAVTFLETFRGVVGGALSRLDYTHSSLLAQRENLVASESRIRDADLAEETAGLTRAQVLQASSVSLLAQANVAPENALLLLSDLSVT